MPKLGENEVLNEVADILVDITGYQKTITLATSLGLDIGLGGDDVTDFVARVQQCFNVDISEIDSTKFFPDEGSLSGLSLVKRWLGFSSGYDLHRYKALHVSDIVKIILDKSQC